MLIDSQDFGKPLDSISSQIKSSLTAHEPNQHERNLELHYVPLPLRSTSDKFRRARGEAKRRRSEAELAFAALQRRGGRVGLGAPPQGRALPPVDPN